MVDYLSRLQTCSQKCDNVGMPKGLEDLHFLPEVGLGGRFVHKLGSYQRVSPPPCKVHLQRPEILYVDALSQNVPIS